MSAYYIRISDLSSDVCSSDFSGRSCALGSQAFAPGGRVFSRLGLALRNRRYGRSQDRQAAGQRGITHNNNTQSVKNGRVSSRVRVRQKVYIMVVAEQAKKTPLQT